MLTSLATGVNVELQDGYGLHGWSKQEARSFDRPYAADGKDEFVQKIVWSISF